ncbi:hypothetical protein V8B97DRAFT_17095 [Scleroderma yunnanense]
MSIRRKSTTHDLATLRLHPDGSRVQQSSINTRQRTAKYTVIDARGNWIAQDAGGRCSVKKRRSVSVAKEDADEMIRLSSDINEDSQRTRERRRRTRNKGKQRAVEGNGSEQLNTRAKHKLSFMQNFSFLDPPEEPLISEPDGVSFPPPASELLKSIHHFASCYYRERGQLSDSDRSYREEKKKRRHSIHVLAANKTTRESPVTDEGDEWEDEDEECGGNDDKGDGDGGQGTSQDDLDIKDMYKAFDGSALMAIGIVLQEQIAHILATSSG